MSAAAILEAKQPRTIFLLKRKINDSSKAFESEKKTRETDQKNRKSQILQTFKFFK